MLGGVERGDGVIRHIAVLSRLPPTYLVDVTSPNIPIFINTINSLVTFLVIFPINHIIKGLPNPAELIVFLQQQHVDRLVQRLEVRNYSYEIGQGSIGVRDLGLWLSGLGCSICGGGMRCFDARKSKDYSVFLIESYSSYC